MPRYKYSVTVGYQTKSGEIEADSYSDGKQKVARMYDGIAADDVSLSEKSEALKSVAENAAVGVGCLGIGLLQLILSAIPIAIAILMVLWFLKSCT